MTTPDLLKLYQQFNFRPVFWERKGNEPREWKGPRDKGWNDPNRVYDLSQYDPAKHNLGLFTGHEIEPGKILVDVDFDYAPAVPLAQKLLPKTYFGFGREGKPVSHALYTVPERVPLLVYNDIAAEGDEDGKTIVELRCGDSSHMTMVAPSLHSPGVNIKLVDGTSIAHVSVEVIKNAVLDYAIGSIISIHLAGGFHHDGRIALSGFLLKQGFAPERVLLIGQEICRLQVERGVSEMSHTDIADMALVINSTQARMQSDKKIAGGPKLAEFIGPRGKEVLTRIRKWLGQDTDKVILDAAEPMRSARVFVDATYTTEGKRTLYNQNKVFYYFLPPAYRECDEAAARAIVWKFLDAATTWSGGEEPTLGPFKPNTLKVNNVLDALRGVTNLPLEHQAPCWLANDPGLAPLEILACPNGLLHLPTRKLFPPTPDFFTLNGLDFAYDAAASPPNEWLNFLSQLWPEDQESIDTLQEVFGYLLTADTHFQKIFMLIGPKRSGKSIIGRVLAKLVGERNTAKPMLSSFGDRFGKQSLIGKTVAIVADARLSARTDTAMIAETLLSISGEDSPGVPRKFLDDWIGRLGVRFVLVTNELPAIGDVSGALASRFVILSLRESFLGREDLGLYDRIERELPSILNWALEGRDRLYKRKFFIQPQSATDYVDEFGDLSSPQAAFISQCTERAGEVSVADLFAAWRLYCVDNNFEQPGTVQSFGKHAHAAMPWARVRKAGPKGDQQRVWNGVRLNEGWAQRVLDASGSPKDEGM